MHAIIFSSHKQRIAQFRADGLSFEEDADGLLVMAQGEMVFQDTPSLENYLSGGGYCNVAILGDEDGTVIDDRFSVTFLVCEPNELVVRLS